MIPDVNGREAFVKRPDRPAGTGHASRVYKDPARENPTRSSGSGADRQRFDGPSAAGQRTGVTARVSGRRHPLASRHTPGEAPRSRLPGRRRAPAGQRESQKTCCRRGMLASGEPHPARRTPDRTECRQWQVQLQDRIESPVRGDRSRSEGEEAVHRRRAHERQREKDPDHGGLRPLRPAGRVT